MIEIIGMLLHYLPIFPLQIVFLFSKLDENTTLLIPVRKLIICIKPNQTSHSKKAHSNRPVSREGTVAGFYIWSWHRQPDFARFGRGVKPASFGTLVSFFNL